MHRQIVAIFFSIILLSGVTGAFSSVPVFAATKEKIDVEVIFVTSLNECSKRNDEAADHYTWVTHQYLDQYNIVPNMWHGYCTPEKYLTESINDSTADLLVIIPDVWNSIQWLVTKGKLGHYVYNGRNNVIVSEAISLYVESKSATWVLSHELAHFALSYKGYTSDVYLYGVHDLQEAYNNCIDVDSTGAFCPQLWTTVKTNNGQTFPVMAPLYTENYSKYSTPSISTTGKAETLITHFKTPTMIVDNGYQTVNAGDYVTFTGYLWEKLPDRGIVPIIGAKIQIVDLNKYKSSQDSYIPLMGNGVTDSKGKFSISWNAIKHTGLVSGDSSMWNPVVHFYGDSKYNPSKEFGNAFWVKEYSSPKFETKSTKMYDQGTIWLEQYEYALPLQGIQPVIINGEVEGDHDGETVKMTVQFSDGNVYSYTLTITNGKFSSQFNFGTSSLAGSYHIVMKHDGKSRDVVFNEATFKMIKNTSTSTFQKSNEPIKEKSQFRAFGETSDGVSLSLSKHALDVAGTLSDRRVEIVVGVQDWKERETEPKVQIFGLYEKGRTSVQHPPLTKSQGNDGITYFKGYVMAKRGMYLATYEVQVNWAKYTDGTPVRMSPSVETYEVFDSNPGYNENQSYKNRAYDDKQKFENKIDLYAQGIKTAEQSLAGLQYGNSEAQKKIDDAWDVRWMAVTKLDSIKTNFKKANNSLENGKYKDATLRFETIEKTSGHLEDDLKWISAAISDADKLEEQHKIFGFFDYAFASKEGTNCIWFICW